MAIRKTPVTTTDDTDLFAALETDPKARAAWLEADTARNAAELMRDARKRRGLTQAAMAKAMNVSQARISQVESGKIEDMPPLEFLARYLDACGETLSLASDAAAPAVKAAPTKLMKRAFSGSVRPRLSVFRSSRKVYAQIIDDTRVVLKVNEAATKSQIKEAVERLLNLKVKSVNTLLPGKKPRTQKEKASTKRATLTFQTGQTIDLAGKH